MSIHHHMHLRRRVLVAILLLGRFDLRRQLVLLLRKLLVILELLQIRVVAKRALAREIKAPLHGRASQHTLPPCLHAGECIQVDARESQHVDPAETGNVGDAVPVADEVVVVLELLVQDTDEALRLARVALHAVGDALLGEAIKVVGLALHGAEAAVLPCNPLLGARHIERVGEAELVLGIVVACEVRKDGFANRQVVGVSWKPTAPE